MLYFKEAVVRQRQRIVGECKVRATISSRHTLPCVSSGHGGAFISFLASLLIFWIGIHSVAAQEPTGLRGDPEAIRHAQAMVETMGGMATWRELKSVHFVHEWDLANRTERYMENEILDLTGPRSYVTMESETYSRIRAYSPEHGYWNVVNGEFAFADDSAFENAMERAPYSIYRLARAVARGDEHYELQFGKMRGIPEIQAIEFHDPAGDIHAWIALNARKEPILWATTQYVYTFGPMRRFGNLRVPNWATTSSGLVRYEMVSLKGSVHRPDDSLFAVPVEFR